MELQGYKPNWVVRKSNSPKLITELPNEILSKNCQMRARGFETNLLELMSLKS